MARDAPVSTGPGHVLAEKECEFSISGPFWPLEDKLTQKFLKELAGKLAGQEN